MARTPDNQRPGKQRPGNQRTRLPIDSAGDRAEDLTCDVVGRIPVRRVLGSTGISVAIHVAAFLFLSLIAIAQKDLLPGLVSEVRFEDPGSDGAVLMEVPDLELPDIEARSPDLQNLTLAHTPNAGPVSSELDVDLTAFASGSDNPPGHGLPEALAGIASGIQDRVAKAGGRKGEVQFSLAWQSFNDVDLHVIAPSGEHISWSHRNSRCHGSLDVDMNATGINGELARDVSDEPVENVRWLGRSAPSGRFTILIHQFRWRNGQSRDPFQLLVNLGGKTELVEETVTAQRPISVHRFRYIPSTLSAGRRAKLAAELTATQTREEVEATAILERGLPMARGPGRDRVMRSVITRFPHTDASIRAMQELEADVKKGN